MPLIQTKIYKRGIPVIPIAPRAVAAGTGGQIHTVERGQFTSTARASGITEPIYQGLWTGTCFLLSSGSGHILRSVDGITWAQVRAPANGVIVSIISNGYGRCVAFFKQANVIAFSRSEDDGLTWGPYSTNPSTNTHFGTNGATYNWDHNTVMVKYSRSEGSASNGIKYDLIDFDTLTVIPKPQITGVEPRINFAYSFGHYSNVTKKFYYIEWDNTNWLFYEIDPITWVRTLRDSVPATNNQGGCFPQSPYSYNSLVQWGYSAGVSNATKYRRHSTNGINFTQATIGTNVYGIYCFAFNPDLDYASVGYGGSGNNPGGHFAWGGVSPTFVPMTSYGTGKSVGPIVVII